MLLSLDKLGVKQSTKAFPRISEKDKAWFKMASFADYEWKGNQSQTKQQQLFC
jgi:hypothetical protein